MYIIVSHFFYIQFHVMSHLPINDLQNLPHWLYYMGKEAKSIICNGKYYLIIKHVNIT